MVSTVKGVCVCVCTAVAQWMTHLCISIWGTSTPGDTLLYVCVWCLCACTISVSMTTRWKLITKSKTNVSQYSQGSYSWLQHMLWVLCMMLTNKDCPCNILSLSLTHFPNNFDFESIFFLPCSCLRYTKINECESFWICHCTFQFRMYMQIKEIQSRSSSQVRYGKLQTISLDHFSPKNYELSKIISDKISPHFICGFVLFTDLQSVLNHGENLIAENNPWVLFLNRPTWTMHINVEIWPRHIRSKLN